MTKPSLLDILFSKDENGDGLDNRSGGFYAREFSVAITKKMRRLLTRGFFRFAKNVSYFLAHISAKAYGGAILTFGLISTLMFFLGLSKDGGIATPIIGVAFASVAIPFLLTDKPIPIMLQDFEPTDYLFFEFFCMKRHTVLEGERKISPFLSVFIGAIPAVLSAFVPLWVIAIVIGIIICVYIGIESPEFLFLASIAFLPYMSLVPKSENILAVTLILVVLSFAAKFLYGKRVLYIEQYDIFIIAMLVFVLISGIFVKGTQSFSGSVRMIVFAIGYPLAGNLITNRRLADRVANTIVIPGAIAGLISVVQFVTITLQSDGGLSMDQLNVILSRHDGLAVCLMASVIFAVGMIRQSSALARGIYTVSAVVSMSALIISGEIFAVFAMLLCVLAHKVIKSNKLIWIILPVMILLPLSVLLLPNHTLDSIFLYSPSISSAEELFSLWRHSLEVFLNNIFVGIGIGKESFAIEMGNLGVFGYPDSSNLFIELGLEAGVFALICFLLLLITRLGHRASRYLYVRNSQIETLSAVSGAALFCLLAFGMVNYIWSDISAYYLFWCVFGMGSATLRVAKRDYDDRVLYYEETGDSDSSVIDIEIG
jgi:hypothetical protein